jgi:taurine dioxygenase
MRIGYHCAKAVAGNRDMTEESREMGIIVRPLSDALGAEIAGVDLRCRLDGDTFSRIADAWRKHLVLLFRDQRLSTEEQIAFASLFGEMQEVRTAPGVSHANPHVMMVSNVEEEDWKGVLPDGEMQLHADQCYYEHPCKLTMLYALEVPPVGGDTMFVNCYSAYDTLPSEIKSEIAGLEALNVYDYDANATIRENEINPDAPRFTHPVVTTHPETGRKVLYVNRLMTDHIVGLDPDESRALLDRLIETAERPELIYRHVWRIGDVVMWDNRCTLHGRTGFDPSHRRMLRRVTVKGERPSR